MKVIITLVSFCMIMFVSGANAQNYKWKADDVYQAYDENEVAADMKFKGKIIVIVGDIQDIGKDLLDKAYIVIGGEGMLDGVQCSFTKSSEPIIAKLKKGQKVTVKGKVRGKMGNVLVDNAEIQ